MRGLIAALLLGVAAHAPAAAQTALPLWLIGELGVINVVPNGVSGETNQDAEPNLAVNPANPLEMVATAFTPGNGACAANTAPVFLSTNRGATWALTCVVPSDAASSGTGDITVRYGTTGGVLYGGILRRPAAGRRLNILNGVSPGIGNPMNVLVDRNQPDQPYVQAITVAGQDRVYVPHNDLGFAGGQTATVELSQSGSAATPVFTTARIERRATVGGQNGPAVRTAPHADSTVYAAYFGVWQRTGAIRTVDVVVVRDDQLGASTPPFAALTDPVDGVAGNRVVRNVALTWNTGSAFGQERLGSYLSITVHPGNSDEVWLAWVDTGTTNTPTIHVRRSTDRGLTWDATDRRTIAGAINPALALNTNGEVGFIYQQLANVAGTQRWITLLERSSNAFTGRRTDTLATVPSNQPAVTFLPYIGDYVHLLTQGTTFYGVFSAANRPVNANFPSGVTYQRNADFTANQLLANDGVTVVAQSIDPFFVRARSGTIIDFCRIGNRCIMAELEPARILWRCDAFPCVVLDPLPRNCLVKWKCPGCEGALCPGWYEIRLQGLPPGWHVELVDPSGAPYAHVLRREGDSLLVGFSPRLGDFEGETLGNYQLVFTAHEGRPGTRVTLRAQLDVRPLMRRYDMQFRPGGE